MKTLFRSLLLVAAVAAAGRISAQTREGSHLPADENACQMCHGEPDLWEQDKIQYLINTEKLANDLHYKKGVNCHDCHGGDPTVFDPSQLHSAEAGFRKLSDVWKACADCHQQPAEMLIHSAHVESTSQQSAPAADAGDTPQQADQSEPDSGTKPDAEAKPAEEVKPEEGAKSEEAPAEESGAKAGLAVEAGKRPMSCWKCHLDVARHDMVAVTDAQSPVFPANLDKTCGTCHETAWLDLVKGVHAKAGQRDANGHGTPMTCTTCHGENAHAILPADDPGSPVFVDKQVQLCGNCHGEDLDTYARSVHGHGLFKSGLLVTAVCANCHRAHGIYRPADDRSSLNPAKVADTCGQCHRYVEQRLQKSVHGSGNGPGTLAERVAPGGKEKRKPSCTSCHAGHDIENPELSAFRLELPNRCGNCHAQLSREYGMSMHGELTELGYVPAAKCSDCHGAHEILAISNPDGPLAPANRLETCRKCHPRAGGNFLDFDPHADQNDPDRYPILHAVYIALLTLIFTVFGFFGLHSIFWLVRGTVEVVKHGRARGLVPGKPAYVRFNSFHRSAHTIMLISFLGLALTGLPLKYSHYDWAKTLAYYLGGFESTSVWHRLFGVVTLVCFVAYMVRMLNRFRVRHSQGVAWHSTVFGPESPIPNIRDVKDFGRMVRWFVGLGPKPTFERWSYWEKFDFWGACADIVIIGFTGLVLWFPNFFCAFLPGMVLNLAKVIHSTQALLATGFVFAIHFFNAHFRAEKFPADMSVLTGLVSEEEMEEERPDFCERLRREGRLDQLRQKTPSRAYLWAVRLAGYVALAIGLALLAGMLLAGLSG